MAKSYFCKKPEMGSSLQKKVLIVDEVHPLILEVLNQQGFSCDYIPDCTRDETARIIGDYVGIIIRSKFRLDREILKQASNMKFIGRVGSGLEKIDTGYAAKAGIACFNSPGGNRIAVGEHALGMLLSLLNHMNRADQEVRDGKWRREENRGTEIRGKTIGIIGYGNTGSAFARCLKGFDAFVISYDKYKNGYEDGFTKEVSLEDIFTEADIISFHLPYTEETHYMVDASFIERCSKKIWLVNTSRGRIVNTGDLVAGLQSGKIKGAALDVLEYEADSFEELTSDLPVEYKYLVNSDRVILTPHIAGWTRESNVNMARELVEKILEFFKE